MAKDRMDRDDEDLVRLYLSDIGQYTLLTKDDEVRLAQAIEEGREARAELDGAEADKKVKLTPSRKQALERATHRGEVAAARLRPVEPAPRRLDREEVPGVGAARCST